MCSASKTSRREKHWRRAVATLVAAVWTLGAAARAHGMPIPFMYAGIPVISDPTISMSGLSQPFWGWAGGPPSIRINPDHWAIMPEGTQQFLLDHERGHWALSHSARRAASLPLAQKEWDADTFAARAMMRSGQRLLLEQHVRWLRWMAVTAPPPLPPYAAWQVQADHVLAVAAEFAPARK